MENNNRRPWQCLYIAACVLALLLAMSSDLKNILP
jgi:hypothetical protein